MNFKIEIIMNNSLAENLNSVIKFYNWTLSISDPRVTNWPLMQNYLPTFFVTILYLLSIYFGKLIMKNKPPYKIQYFLIMYNVLMVLLNFYICSQLFYHSWTLNYNYLCQPVNTDINNISEMKIAHALWWFYISKLIEFLDTIIFVFRKKNDQISFLHIYHHVSMLTIWWIGVKWIPGGSAFLGPMINSFVHVVMYSYYGMSAIGSSVRKFLFWKKYLTCLQLIQFLIGLVLGLNLIIRGCEYIPKWMVYTGIVYGISMISLFLNFYYRAYILQERLWSCSSETDKMKLFQNGHVKSQ